jgi:5-amino-6-(5-phosphoribosylamino)uracil reductase
MRLALEPGIRCVVNLTAGLEQRDCPQEGATRVLASRPYVVLSCAMSVDGYIDDVSDQRLVLSNDDDFDRVDEERAASDAILVGANTIRRDNPRLLVRSEPRQADRADRGLTTSPAKATVTASGELSREAQFFTAGGADIARLVYCPTSVAARLVHQLRNSPGVEVIRMGHRVGLAAVLADLADRGVGRLLAEGGTTIHTRLLAEGLVDELHLVVAPFFVGGSGAPRFVSDDRFPFDAAHRMKLAEVRQIGDVALLRYVLRPQFGGHDP